MADEGRVVTAKLPEDLVSRIDEVADRIDRSKSWIVRQALMEWLAEEQRRYELTLEALKDVDEGRTIPHEDVLAMIEQRKRDRREAGSRSAPGNLSVRLVHGPMSTDCMLSSQNTTMMLPTQRLTGWFTHLRRC